MNIKKGKVLIRLEHEAQKRNLTYLGNANKKRYKIYQFNECGHKKIMLPEAVRTRKEIPCEICIEIKQNELIKDAGLELVKKGKEGKNTYKIKSCGHLKEIAWKEVKNKHFKCQICFKEKLEREAKQAGLKIIGSGKSGRYRRYKFIKCKHIDEFQLIHVRNKEITCKQCHENGIKKIAKKNNLQYLGKASKKTLDSHHYRKFKFNECGHDQEIRIDHLKEGWFICNTCEKTSLDKPSKIYLLEITVNKFSYLKLGYAKNINTRIKTYRLDKKAIVKRIKIINISTGREAKIIENDIHKRLKKIRINPTKMKQYMYDGFNECYNIDKKELLIDEVNMAG